MYIFFCWWYRFVYIFGFVHVSLCLFMKIFKFLKIYIHLIWTYSNIFLSIVIVASHSLHVNKHTQTHKKTKTPTYTHTHTHTPFYSDYIRFQETSSTTLTPHSHSRKLHLQEECLSLQSVVGVSWTSTSTSTSTSPYTPTKLIHKI